MTIWRSHLYTQRSYLESNELEGTKSFWMKGESLNLYIYPYVCPFKAGPGLQEPGSNVSEACSGVSKAGLGLSEASSGPSEAGPGLLEAGSGRSEASLGL